MWPCRPATHEAPTRGLHKPSPMHTLAQWFPNRGDSAPRGRSAETGDVGQVSHRGDGATGIWRPQAGQLHLLPLQRPWPHLTPYSPWRPSVPAPSLEDAVPSAWSRKRVLLSMEAARGHGTSLLILTPINQEERVYVPCHHLNVRTARLLGGDVGKAAWGGQEEVPLERSAP